MPFSKPGKSSLALAVICLLLGGTATHAKDRTLAEELLLGRPAHIEDGDFPPLTKACLDYQKAHAGDPCGESELQVFSKLLDVDHQVNDPGNYAPSQFGSIALSQVDQTPSVKRHTMQLNGQTRPYIARAGHLVAYRHSPNGAATQAEAAIFYTSYTRDALPKEKRPVTFLWNGGPGSSSIWLHLGSWGPMRLKSDAPNIPAHQAQAKSFPFVENTISLLDQTDIVFIDPPGTGLSAAIAPHTNQDFWGTDADAQVVADFITAYINRYNRQNSPKYLYGESYGGIRTPIVANLLLQSGTTAYKPDSTGNLTKARVLDGIVLNSPLLDYATNCNMDRTVSCEGYIPSYGMVADYYGSSNRRGGRSKEAYLEELKQFARTSFRDVVSNHMTVRDSIYLGYRWHKLTPDSTWNSYIATDRGAAILTDLSEYIGVRRSALNRQFNYLPYFYQHDSRPGFFLGRYDARMNLPGSFDDPDEYIDRAFENQLKAYLPDFLNYKSAASYQVSAPIIDRWHWQHAARQRDSDKPESLSDLQAVLTAKPDIKLLIIHGYEDIATPGYQTELDLEGANLRFRVPVKWFEGGHMIYNTESSREPLKQTLTHYYAAPSENAEGAALALPDELAPVQ